jgi:hypothetical protein
MRFARTEAIWIIFFRIIADIREKTKPLEFSTFPT